MVAEVEKAVRLKLKKFVLVNNKYPSAGTLLKYMRGTNKEEVSLLLEEIKKEYPNFTNFLVKLKEETKEEYEKGNDELIEIVDVLVDGNDKISRYYTNGYSVKEGNVVIVNYYGNNLEGIVVGNPYHVYKDFVAYEYKPIKSVKGIQELETKTMEHIIEFVSTYLLLNKSFDQINKTKEYCECSNKEDIEKIAFHIKMKYPNIGDYIEEYKQKMIEDYQKSPEDYVKVVDVERVYKRKTILKPYLVEDNEYQLGDEVIATVYEERGKIVSESYYVLKKYCKDLTSLKRPLYKEISSGRTYRLNIIAQIKKKKDIKLFQNEETGMKRLIGGFEELFDFYNRFYSSEDENSVLSFSDIDLKLEEQIFISLDFYMKKELKYENIILGDIKNAIEGAGLIEISSEIIKM